MTTNTKITVEIIDEDPVYIQAFVADLMEFLDKAPKTKYHLVVMDIDKKHNWGYNHK